MANESVDTNLIRIPLTTGFRRFLYIVKPSEASFTKEDDVPNYVDEV